MVRISLITTAALFSSLIGLTANADSLGFEGRWGLVGTQCAASGDLVPTEITATEIRYYESRCQFSQIEPIGDRGVSWRVTAQCSGEGMTWPVSYIVGLYDVQQGQMLSMVNLTNGNTWLAERCE